MSKELKKHVAAVHIGNKLSLLQRKAANVLLLNAYDDLLTRDIHQIRIADLAKFIGFDSHNQDVLKDALRGLMSTVLEWNLLDAKGKEDGWEGSPMLAHARIQGGYCYYSYSLPLREKLYNPEIYARINLGIQRGFSSGYALALYENCVRFRNTQSTGWLQLETFRALMGVPSEIYPDFKRFSQRVIREPMKQVNNSSDIHLDVEYVRERRKVVKLRFIVTDNPQMSLFGTKLALDETTRDNAKSAPALEHNPEVQVVGKRLREFGLSEDQVRKVLGSHDKEYIEANLEVVQRDHEAGKVKNLAAYTMTALDTDFRPKRSVIENVQQKKRQETKRKNDQRKKARADLEAFTRAFETHQLQQAILELSEQEREALEARFKEEHKSNPVCRKWGKAGSMDHPIIQSLFRSFAISVLLDKVSDAEFAAFVAGQGRDLETLRREVGDIGPQH